MNIMRFNRTKCKVLHMGKGIPWYTVWRDGEQSCWKRLVHSVGLKRWLWGNNMHSKPRKQTVFLAASKAGWPAGQGRWSPPSALLLWDPTWGAAPSSGVPSIGSTRIWWSESRGKSQKWSEVWYTSPIRKRWESWGCSGWRREGSRVTLLPSSTWRGPTRKMGID